MNIKSVLRTYSLLRQLSDDETALLETLRAMNDSEREALVETLSPQPAKSATTATRKIEHCAACDYTKRAVVHKDPNASGYHEFQASSGGAKKSASKKSSRASSLEQQIKGAARGGGITLCGAKLTSSGLNCNLPEGHALHAGMGYADSHPFSPTASPASDSSSANGGGGNSTANAETSADVTTSVGGSN